MSIRGGVILLCLEQDPPFVRNGNQPPLPSLSKRKCAGCSSAWLECLLWEQEVVSSNHAHKQLRAIESDASQTAQMNEDYDAAKHLAPNGKSYPTAYAWKFNCLIHEYKQANPLELEKNTRKLIM